MKTVSSIAFILLILKSTSGEHAKSSTEPACSESKKDTLLNLTSDSSYDVFRGDKCIKSRMCPSAEYFNKDNSKCEKKPQNNLNSSQEHIGANVKPIVTLDDFLWAVEALVNDVKVNMEQNAKYADKQKSVADSENRKEVNERNLEQCGSDTSCHVNELYSNLDKSSTYENLYTKASNTENESSHTSSKKANSSEKLKEFTREVTIPIIQDIVNDPKKMSKVARLFRIYFQAFAPLAKEMVEQFERNNILSFPKKQFLEAMKTIKDSCAVFQEAALEILPSVLTKISNHTDLLLDAVEETTNRFQINFYGLIFKSFLSIFHSLVVDEKSADAFVEIPAMFDIRKDIETIFKIIEEVSQDVKIVEMVNPATLLLQSSIVVHLNYF